MINSNHFDAGYADITQNVVNNYFTNYFPRAANVGAALRKSGKEPLNWMTFSYLISLYLDCPSGMGLACPNSTMRELVIEAIKVPSFYHHTHRSQPFTHQTICS